MPATNPPNRLLGLSRADAERLAAAGAALDAGRVQEAGQRLQELSADAREHAEVLRMEAGLLDLLGRHAEAIGTMQRALALRPQDALYHNTLATLLGNAGHLDEAIAALQRCCQLQPSFALAWYNLGVLLTRCVRNDEAAAALQRAVELMPGHAGAQALLADLLRTTGQNERATAAYRQLLAARPVSGMAWWGLADLRTTHFTDEDIARMQAALRDPAASDDDRIATGFALAKALDEAARPADALTALAQANALARQRRPWNAAAFSAGIDATLQAFAPPPAPADAMLGEGVVFIASLPRSGSTLVEQIIASHSMVEGAGELPDLPLVLGEESRRRNLPFPQWVGQMQPADWARLGRRYLERTAHWRRTRPRHTDKLPNNWMYVGAIRAMLPAARIVLCRRDPLETCFSCYRQFFAGNEYTRSFGDLAAFWRDFERSARHWQALHPAHVFLHDYERLLAEPEAHIRRLLDFCGLPFEQACVSFHENRRTVRSPSANQVRQPLRRDTARAPHYGALLDPLRAALGLPAWPA